MGSQQAMSSPEDLAITWGLGPGQWLWPKFFEPGRAVLRWGAREYPGHLVDQLYNLPPELAAMAAWMALLGRRRRGVQEGEPVRLTVHPQGGMTSERLRFVLGPEDKPWHKVLCLLGLVHHERLEEWKRCYMLTRRGVTPGWGF